MAIEIVKPGQSEEDKESQDANAPAEVDKESGPQEGEDVTPPDPTFSHGVTIIANLNGEGIQIVPVSNSQEVRVATIDDILGLLQAALSHIQSNLAASKVLSQLKKDRQLAAEAKAINDKRSQQRR